MSIYTNSCPGTPGVHGRGVQEETEKQIKALAADIRRLDQLPELNDPVHCSDISFSLGKQAIAAKAAAGAKSGEVCGVQLMCTIMYKLTVYVSTEQCVVESVWSSLYINIFLYMDTFIVRSKRRKADELG
jgi:hypothetical protein